MSVPLQLGMGAFIPPIHAPHRNPTLALRRDLEFVEYLDQVGFDEAWFGEHHGIGWETSGSPEIIIAAAAERTRRIRLGTGVISLPYHHPLMVADRLVLLDHITRGRMIFGAGPGAFPSDSVAMGLDFLQNRDKMVEALDAILELLRSDEPVNRKTDWFELKDARLNLRPYTAPCFEVCTVSVVSPSGPRLAGQYGLGVLSLAPNNPKGWDLLSQTWELVEQLAAEHGQSVNRSSWRCVGFFHIAETEEQARAEVKWGLKYHCDYLNTLNPVSPIHPPEITDPDKIIDYMNETGYACIGDPERMQNYIDGMLKQTGGFGSFLSFVHEMADYEATKRSHALFASEVIPVFQGTTIRPQKAYEFFKSPSGSGSSRNIEYNSTALTALDRARKQHQAEREAKQVGSE